MVTIPGQCTELDSVHECTQCIWALGLSACVKKFMCYLLRHVSMQLLMLIDKDLSRACARSIEWTNHIEVPDLSSLSSPRDLYIVA